jgi:hypothetical protein
MRKVPQGIELVVFFRGRGRQSAQLKGRKFDAGTGVDVVRPSDRVGWTVDPFGGEIKEGRLYGRYSLERKGGVAAAKALGDALTRIPVTRATPRSPTRSWSTSI